MKIVDYKIIIPENAVPGELRAASFIRQNVRLVCGKTLPIETDASSPTDLEIVVGETNREALDELKIERSTDLHYEYLIFKKGKRLYLTGLGKRIFEEPTEFYSYNHMNDGALSTAFASYRFVTDILGYDFVWAPFDVYPERPDLEMPDAYDYRHTNEEFYRQRPEFIKGASLYFLQPTGHLEWNNQSFIIKTKDERLIVIDGGCEPEAERLIECLKTLSGSDKPHVSAWLFSHLHGDHFGAYYAICKEEKYRGALTVEKVYHGFCDEDFYTSVSVEKIPHHMPALRAILASDATGAEVIRVNTGDVISVDDIKFEVIWTPVKEDYHLLDTNDSSVVYKMTHEESGQTIMFLGDGEYRTNYHLINDVADKLKSDIVQMGHHGCGNVSRRCYELIGAKVAFFPISEKFWFADRGEGLNTHNIGVERNRTYVKTLGFKRENVYVNTDRIISERLPFPIR